ncbi:hypothetical protein M0813_28368 [Anaeramoeba flamelloides]|uniref:SIT4 phosphatase-associated protein n=1 Tax=Anaeramoeba flamelloides TaxID=1746091 RepID=A0ABQ8XT88_9EUKA|nr:hypothetical protein M0813_28368 [Anaeramoeba flamelloides]
MFWRFNFSLKSKIDEILEKEEFTFQDLLEEEDLLQECSLSKPETVKATLQYLLVEPTEENVSEKVKYKYPYLANEIIGLELFGIVDVISSDTELLDFIFKFLDNKNPLNSVYSGYFSRCVGIQLRKRSEETLNYLEKHPEIIDKLCSHLETSAIKDVILHLLVGCENTELLEKTTNIHDNITRCILDFIFNEGKNPILLKELENLEIIEKLISCVINSSTGSSHLIENTLSIIIELLIIIKESNRVNIEEELHPLLKLIFEKFPKFVKLLDSPTDPQPINLSFGRIETPVGHSRLKIIQFFHILYFVVPEKIETQYCELGILKKILDLFFQYKWNSFLHIGIRELINSILQGNSNKLIDEIILNYKIIPKMMAICDQYEDSKTKQEYRRGNFNHIFQICNKIVQVCEKNNSLNDKCLTFENWDKFVVDFLGNINRIRSQKIGEIKKDFKLLYEDNDYDSQNLDDNDNDFFDEDSDEDSDDDFDIFNNFDDEVIIKEDEDDETPSWLAENDSFETNNNFILKQSKFNEEDDSSGSSTEESTEEEDEDEDEDEDEEEIEEDDDEEEDDEEDYETVEKEEKEEENKLEKKIENNDQNKINNIEIEKIEKIVQDENNNETEELEMKSPPPKDKII